MKICTLVDKTFLNLIPMEQKHRGFFGGGCCLFGGFIETYADLNSIGKFYTWAKAIQGYSQIQIRVNK